MKKKPICIVITDSHIFKTNCDLVENIFDQLIQLCKSLKVNEVIHGGDWFTSRPGQPLETLKSTEKIIKKLIFNSINTTIIPGNHDKKNLDSNDSYLDVFNQKGFRVVNESDTFLIDKVRFSLIPYFNKELYIEKLENLNKELDSLKKKEKSFLITHIAINGVKNNDGSEVKDSYNVDVFSTFDKVLVGHYHNRSNVGEKIHYIGSPYCSNYGEDNSKGCCIIYDDGTIDYRDFEFPKFLKYEIDIKDLSEKEIVALKKEKGTSDDNIRIIVKGSQERLKAFNRGLLTDIGIDCKLESEEITVLKQEAIDNKFHIFDNQSIVTEFQEFCKQKEHNFDKGMEYLTKIL